MLAASSRIWTQITVSISNNDIHYTMSASVAVHNNAKYYVPQVICFDENYNRSKWYNNTFE